MEEGSHDRAHGQRRLAYRVIARHRLPDRSAALAAEIADEAKPRRPTLPVVADLATEGSLAAMAAEVQEYLGTPTVLVNSAAIGAPHADITEQLAADLAGDGITVNSVSPGQTPTKLRGIHEAAGTPPEETGGSTAAIPVGRCGLLDDYVGAILFLSSGLVGYITGLDIPVEGGVRLVRPDSS